MFVANYHVDHFLNFSIKTSSPRRDTGVLPLFLEWTGLLQRVIQSKVHPFCSTIVVAILFLLGFATELDTVNNASCYYVIETLKEVVRAAVSVVFLSWAATSKGKFQTISTPTQSPSYLPNRPSLRRTSTVFKTRHYHLRLRQARRHSMPSILCSDFLEIDPQEFLASSRHRSLHIPEYTYGANFNEYTSKLNPLLFLQVFHPNFLSLPVQHTSQLLIAADNCQSPVTSGDHLVYFNKDSLALPIVIDSGATMSLTPVLSDFITPLQVPLHAHIRQVNGLIKIEGIGQVRWSMHDLFGSTATVETTAYYIPSADVRLFSPQVYLQDNPGAEYIMQCV